MPTFLLLRWEFSNASTNMNGKVIEVERVRGADVAALRALVGRAVGLAAAMGQGQSQSMGGGGNVLGSSGTSTTSSGGGGGTNRVKRSGGEGWYALVARFVMLYLVTLFSLDPVASVEGRGWVSKVKTG